MISPIQNGESGESARAKINGAIARSYLGFINVRDVSGEDVTVINNNEFTDLTFSPAVKFVQNGLELNGTEVENTGAQKNVLMLGKIDLTSGPNNQIEVGFAKNGVIVPCSVVRITTPTGGRSQSVTFFCTEVLGTDQVITIQVRNVEATTDITTNTVNFIIQEI